VSVSGATTSYDVAILGGGPAGCATAIELARDGRRVLVLERSHYDDLRVGETIPPQALPWLRRLGVTDAFATVAHLQAPRVVRQWEKPVLLADPLAFEAQSHGWHVDRPRFDALLAEVAERAGAVVRRGAVALSCHRQNDDVWQLQFEAEGRHLDVGARWLIDATGRRSWLLRRLGVRPRALDRLVGLLDYGGPRGLDDLSLFVEGTSLGWWYSAPLPGGRSVAAFMTDGDLIPRDRPGVASFCREQRARSELMSRLHRPATSVRTVVARTVWAGTVAAGRWLAVGDAAMAFDPLFGLGICQALASGSSSARAVLEAEASGDAKAALRQYQSWSESRYRDYLVTRQRIYSSVRRWLDSPFWQRRAGD
jgi:flavin-dependent dehydrogenase